MQSLVHKSSDKLYIQSKNHRVYVRITMARMKNKFFLNNFTFFINFFLNEDRFYRVCGNHSCCLECM